MLKPLTTTTGHDTPPSTPLLSLSLSALSSLPPTSTSASTSPPSLLPLTALPPSTELSYLAEGAANILYRLHHPHFPRHLLRIRKLIPSAQPSQLCYAHLTHTFTPLFPPHLLLTTTLIEIPTSVLARENAQLRILESRGLRPRRRHGVYLTLADPHGYLIPDMSALPLPPMLSLPMSASGLLGRLLLLLPRRPQSRPPPPPPPAAAATGTRQLLVEFKPKWVLASPSAPRGWRRCRTCALRLQRHGVQQRGFCPLDLASCYSPRVRSAVEVLLPAARPAALVLRAGERWGAVRAGVVEAVVGFLVKGELMPLLKRLQGELDPWGPRGISRRVEEDRRRFAAAMTVRDLTVFLRVDLDRGVEVKLGDLDFKNGEGGKWAYWEGVERGLEEGGWYTGGEMGQSTVTAGEKGEWCMP